MAKTIIMTEIEIMAFSPLKMCQSGDLTVHRIEELRVVKYKIVHIDFHQNKEKVPLRGSVTFCFWGLENKSLKETT